jgi:hypothetical protein
MRFKTKSHRGKHQPYKPIKMKMFEVGDPFGDMPMEARRAVIYEAAAKARSTFNTEYPKMAAWFETYDPLYLLSFCAFYFLSSPEGIDREAIEGKLDFGSYHLELLQAFALMRPRRVTAKPLAERTEELLRYLRELGDCLGFAQLDFPPDLPETEVRKRMVISQMRDWTFAVRNWAYPEQAVNHLRSMFAGTLSNIIAGEYKGISIVRVIDVLKVMSEQAEARLNDHIRKTEDGSRRQEF